MVGLGILAAIAETLGIGLAVLFLFTLLDQRQKILDGGGILADLFDLVQSVLGSDLNVIAVAFFVLILSNAALVYANNVLVATALNDVAKRIRDMVHRQYLSASYRFMQSREHGELIHILATESWTISDAFYSLGRMVICACTVAVFGAGIFFLSPVIGVTALLGAIVVLALLRVLSRPIERLGRKTLEANKQLSQRMVISLTGMRTLRAFAQENRLLHAFEKASGDVRRLAVRTERIKAVIGPLGEVASLGTLIVIVMVARRSGIDVATTITAILLLFRLQPFLREIEVHRVSLSGMTAPLRSVRDLLESSQDNTLPDGTRDFPGFGSEICFEDVSFSHDSRKAPSLSRAGFLIPHGKTTIIAGPSGSGKTTVLNLLMSLYQPDAGRILVDGVDLRTYRRATWLDQMSIAGQDIELIDGTVEQNIRLGNQAASMEDVFRVCDIAEIRDDIAALPDGLSTRIGASGLNFSGGQRQRIGLARALLRDPQILILDEAMSALEPVREDRIRQRIAHLMAGRTVIVVSHRRDAATSADEIVRLVGGKVTTIRSVDGASDQSGADG